jgi:ATP phosphoribosyltransferase
MFSWVKAHIGVYGKEMADNEAKEAERSTSTTYELPEYRSYLYYVAAEAKQKWQTEWITSYKAAATKYFPSVRDRLGIKH